MAWSRGSDRDATAMGERIASSGGLQGARVHIERSAGTVRVTVTGKAPLIVDFGLGTIVEFAPHAARTDGAVTRLRGERGAAAVEFAVSRCPHWCY